MAGEEEENIEVLLDESDPLGDVVALGNHNHHGDETPLDESTFLKQELDIRMEQIAILQRELRDTQSELSASESETFILQRRMDVYIRENLELKGVLQSQSQIRKSPRGAEFESELDSHPNGKAANGTRENGTESSNLKAEVETLRQAMTDMQQTELKRAEEVDSLLLQLDSTLKTISAMRHLSRCHCACPCHP